MYFDTTGFGICPASVSAGVSHKLFPSSLNVSLVKFFSAWALGFFATIAWRVTVVPETSYVPALATNGPHSACNSSNVGLPGVL